MNFNGLWSFHRTVDLFHELKWQLTKRNRACAWEYKALEIVAADIARRLNQGDRHEELCMRMMEWLALTGVALDDTFRELSSSNRLKVFAFSHGSLAWQTFFKDEALYGQILDAHLRWKSKVVELLDSIIPCFPTVLNSLILEFHLPIEEEDAAQ